MGERLCTQSRGTVCRRLVQRYSGLNVNTRQEGDEDKCAMREIVAGIAPYAHTCRYGCAQTHTRTETHTHTCARTHAGGALQQNWWSGRCDGLPPQSAGRERAPGHGGHP